jgi:hypothetical protein
MATCSHLDQIGDPAPSDDGCTDCLAIGGRWVHLRRCATCGHVGCCDSSPNRHATAHAAATDHPVAQSFEPGEDWFWCYVDQIGFELGGKEHSPAHP